MRVQLRHVQRGLSLPQHGQRLQREVSAAGLRHTDSDFVAPRWAQKVVFPKALSRKMMSVASRGYSLIVTTTSAMTPRTAIKPAMTPAIE